jgi:hypothetical protein
VVNGSTDRNSCGDSCTVCQDPAGGSVTCNGTSCVQSCPASSHLCNGTCISKNSTQGCGASSCTPCRTPTNGQATCDGSSCGFACNTNAHRCGNNCFLNTDVNHCGDQCASCAGDLHGSPTCQSGACAVTCDAGYHWCANVGTCIVNNSTWPGSCGNACTICPTATGATRTCDGAGNCDLVYSSCLNGLVLCGTDCVAPDDKHCGSSCSDCTTRPGKPSGARGVCTDGACTWTCDVSAGYRNCNPETAPEPRCVSLTSTNPDTCGGSCTPCPTDDNGTRACTGLTCDLNCASSFHKCGTGSNISCESNTDPYNCGTNCTDCTQDASDGFVASCSRGACVYTCDTAHGYSCGPNCLKCSTGESCVNDRCQTPDAGTQPVDSAP